MASAAPLKLARSQRLPIPVGGQHAGPSYSLWRLSDGTPYTKVLCYPVHYESAISLEESGTVGHHEFELEPPSRPQGWSTLEWRIACDAVADGVTTTIFKRVE
ncbi:hypothetical protein FOZ60_009384 [Perkinsus olseni]|uniref:Uncharacterized protein n=1 Tax=Perkinsus olseni TaxID=32597 RepID=A0A7J6NHB2_PEROL|nr:hypothetical protein FOZ60_009384 [Perkinsus olseni]